MRYNYEGFWGCDSCCDIEVHRRSDGKYVFIATEVPDNPGTSVTNFAEYLATAMRRLHGPVGGDPPHSLRRDEIADEVKTSLQLSRTTNRYRPRAKHGS
jgi:hypothetical protein